MSIEEGKQREQTIFDLVAEQRKLLYGLLSEIDNLIERNPKPECETKDGETYDNVFDEIIKTLTQCRGQIREATEKVQGGISRKVQ